MHWGLNIYQMAGEGDELHLRRSSHGVEARVPPGPWHLVKAATVGSAANVLLDCMTAAEGLERLLGREQVERRKGAAG